MCFLLDPFTAFWRHFMLSSVITTLLCWLDSWYFCMKSWSYSRCIFPICIFLQKCNSKQAPCTILTGSALVSNCTCHSFLNNHLVTFFHSVSPQLTFWCVFLVDIVEAIIRKIASLLAWLFTRYAIIWLDNCSGFLAAGWLDTLRWEVL